jgi:hypothetical protein
MFHLMLERTYEVDPHCGNLSRVWRSPLLHRNMLGCLLLRSCFWLDVVRLHTVCVRNCACVFSVCNYRKDNTIGVYGDSVTDLWSIAYSSQSQLVLGKLSVCANRHMLRWADWPEKWTLWEVELLCVLLGYESRNRSAAKRARGSDEAKWRPVLLLLLQASGHWSCRKLRKKITTKRIVGSSRCSCPLSVSKIACKAECSSCTLERLNLRRLRWFLLIEDSFCFTYQRSRSNW